MPRAALTIVLLMLPAALPAQRRAGLEAARTHLRAGEFALVLDDLSDSEQLPGAEVAQVFGAAARMALDKGDPGLASLYCERALRRQKREAQALRVCARVALDEGRAEQAEQWGETLGELYPKDAEVALLRAQAAQARGAWERMVKLLEPHAGDVRAAALLDEARARLAVPASAEPDEPDERELQRRLDEAVAQARALGRTSAGDEAAERQRRPSRHEVVLYTAPWCGVCRRARSWLQERTVGFVEKDIEKDEGAKEELVRKCAKAGLGADAVPVFEVDGELMVGFDAPRLEKLLELD